jgi:hypothetical protein
MLYTHHKTTHRVDQRTAMQTIMRRVTLKVHSYCGRVGMAALKCHTSSTNHGTIVEMTSLSSDETQRLAANACLPTRLDRTDGYVQRSVIRPMRYARQVKQHVHGSMVTCMCAIATALAREDVLPISCAYTNGLVSSIAIHLVHTGRIAARPHQLGFQSLLQHGLCTRATRIDARATICCRSEDV